MISITTLDIFHYNDKTKKYKAFNINPTDVNDAVFVSLTSGSKSDNQRDRIVVKLSRQELAYLIMQTNKIFDELSEEEKGY